jgi:hypothetical protein
MSRASNGPAGADEAVAARDAATDVLPDTASRALPQRMLDQPAGPGRAAPAPGPRPPGPPDPLPAAAYLRPNAQARLSGPERDNERRRRPDGQDQTDQTDRTGPAGAREE